MERKAAHMRRWQVGEVIFGIPLLTGTVLQLIFPLRVPVPRGLKTLAGLSIGSLLLVSGFGLISAGRRELALHSQPTEPGNPTRKLVTSGIFRFTRNPLYLGASNIFLGIGCLLGNPWIFVLFVPTLAACRLILIEPEETYLRGKFGNDYRNYTREVSRWFGRKTI